MSIGEQPATPAQDDLAQTYDGDRLGGQVKSHNTSDVHDGIIANGALEIASSSDADVSVSVMLRADHGETNGEWEYSGSNANIEQPGVAANAVNDTDQLVHVAEPIAESLKLPLLDGVNDGLGPDALFANDHVVHETADGHPSIFDTQSYDGHVALALDADILPNIDITLELLTSSHHLFDVPALDIAGTADDSMQT
jgi:hypothetical protein